MPVGFTVNTHVRRPDRELLSWFSTISSADLSDAMRCSGTVDRKVGLMIPGTERIVGPAITVSIPTISMNILKAGFQQAVAGDIIVVNGMGTTSTAVVGGNMLRSLKDRGIAGIIIDGAIRDISEAREVGLPVFASGLTTATGPEGPDAGEVNLPIACGGVVVNPGDIVVADEDGIAVIPPAKAEEVLAAIDAMRERRAASQERATRGDAGAVNAVEQQLKDAGCAFVEEPQ